MRSALAFLCFCATIAAAPSDHHRSREFNGITASFTLLNPKLRVDDPLRLRISLRNESSRPAVFGRMALSQHIDVFTSAGAKIYIRNGAPISEPALIEDRLQPEDTLERTEDIQLSAYYDLTPGDYYLNFRLCVVCQMSSQSRI